MEDEVYSPAQPQMIEQSIREGRAGVSPADHSPSVGQNRNAANQSAYEQNHMGISAGNTTLDMSSVAAALPDHLYRQMPQQMYQQQYAHPTQTPAMMYPYQGNQYAGAMHNAYSVPYAAQMHPQAFPQQRPYNSYPMNTNVGSGQMFHGQQYYPSQPNMSASIQGPFPQSPQGSNFAQGSNFMYGPRTGQYYGGQVRIDGFGNVIQGTQLYAQTDLQEDHRRGSVNSLKIPSALRGPPRKPKQSGHALWVGNLPPGTNIMDLKDHFSRDATHDIESVFLISKSNCAFVNYKSEQSCTAAMGRFHDSRFNGVRLVCRLRRGSSPTSATIPVGANTGTYPDTKNDSAPTNIDGIAQEDTKLQEEGESRQTKLKIKERYFIIKSLTVEDLERSVHSGIWATQSHNEETLNEAFQSAENVYLIFSANKSGEYFGYARMDSAIDSESAIAVDVASIEVQTPQQSSTSATAETPLTIPTPPTATAPKGYIIDDSARGTIFWEAESSSPQIESLTAELSPANTDSGDVSAEENMDSQAKSPTNSNAPSPSTTFGKPFKITWVSTERLPFYRTRGLRNPWNTNREVKIARDGTELEPGVGRKLVGMFNTGMPAGRAQIPNQYSEMMPQIPGQGPAYRPY